jgi:hypothetical protein
MESTDYKPKILDRIAAFIFDYLGVKTEIIRYVKSSTMTDKQLNKAVLHRNIESLATRKNREVETLKLQKLMHELNTFRQTLVKCYHQEKQKDHLSHTDLSIKTELQLLKVVYQKLHIMYKLARLEQELSYNTFIVQNSQYPASHYLAEDLSARRGMLVKKERSHVFFRRVKVALDEEYDGLCASSFRRFVFEHEKIVFAQKIPNYHVPRAKRGKLSMV